MKYEIERKFLVKDHWPRPEDGLHCVQGYISADAERIVRVRTMGEKSWLTVKSMKTQLTRIEYEYEIPFEDADDLLHNVCKQPLIEKTRFNIRAFDMDWEVDEFHGENSGLTVAEIELEEESQPIQIPDWVGEEISNDHRYFNANLSKNPFSTWK